MVKEDVMLNNKTGLHARPATEIAKTAMSYKSDITFLVNDKKINAKSPLMLMAAGIKSKTEIEIICNGEDEKEALENLKNIIKENLIMVNGETSIKKIEEYKKNIDIGKTYKIQIKAYKTNGAISEIEVKENEMKTNLIEENAQE